MNPIPPACEPLNPNRCVTHVLRSICYPPGQTHKGVPLPIDPGWADADAMWWRGSETRTGACSASLTPPPRPATIPPRHDRPPPARCHPRRRRRPHRPRRRRSPHPVRRRLRRRLRPRRVVPRPGAVHRGARDLPAVLQGGAGHRPRPGAVRPRRGVLRRRRSASSSAAAGPGTSASGCSRSNSPARSSSARSALPSRRRSATPRGAGSARTTASSRSSSRSSA